MPTNSKKEIPHHIIYIDSESITLCGMSLVYRGCLHCSDKTCTAKLKNGVAYSNDFHLLYGDWLEEWERRVVPICTACDIIFDHIKKESLND